MIGVEEGEGQKGRQLMIQIQCSNNTKHACIFHLAIWSAGKGAAERDFFSPLLHMCVVRLELGLVYRVCHFTLMRARVCVDI
jgi:hypothetical protein